MNYRVNTIDQLKPVIKGFRKLRGLSQKDVAQKLGVSQQTYQVLEANPQNVSMERLFRVLMILEVKLELIEKQGLNQPESDENLIVDDEGIW